MDHHGQRRTSIDIEPATMTAAGSSSSSAIHGTSTRRPNSSHRNWIRYVAFACITTALVLLITLLVLRPWQQKQKLLPITNDAVKVLPEYQPIWPVPKSFSHGEGIEKVVLSSNFQIKVQSSANSPPVALAPDSILALAIARCMDRLQVKRNTTIWTTDAPVADTVGTAAAAVPLAELTLVVDNTQAKLEYGMVESYAINIVGKHAGNTEGAPQSLVDLEKRALHLVASLQARAEPDSQLPATAVITASTQWGAIHALNTFTQIVVATKATAANAAPASPPTTVNNQLEIPNTPWSILDEPRFSHRGILLDTSRNYVGVPDIIRTLDAMAVVKLNVFHWHVLDQQTYPLVSKAFPDLTAKGAQDPEKIYTPQDVAAIIQHGLERGIRVLPEFDSPGHAASWGRAYPNLTVCLDAQPHSKYAAEPPAGQLDPLEPFTYTVLDTLVKEWSGLFPDSQAHIGGDEVNMNCWKSSKRLSDYVSNENHRAEYEKAIMPVVDTPNPTTRTAAGRQSGEDKLLELYLDRIFAMFIAQGKRPIVWEEMALEHNVRLPSSAIIQVWKNAANAKKVIAQGRPVILSSSEFWYLDCGAGAWLIGSQGQSWCQFASWQRIYSYSLTDGMSEKEQKMIYGGEICMWGEQTDSSNLDSNIWPRSAAAAEVLWSGTKDTHGHARPLLDASRRLSAVRETLVQMGVKAAPMFPSWCAKHPEACLVE
ncbi:MAG: glycoside hydrolase superfamily [Linnemannia elongata]|nr:MAG: glycoside hydrolase superfamily [Linnemannia elongata]